MEYGSVFETSSNAPFLRENTGFVRDDWRLYRSGRDAMKALARIAGRKRVLLPALCCESMIVPFALNGYEAVFYRLRADLRGDEDDVLSKLTDGALLLYMPYFGVRPFTDGFLQSLRDSGRDLLLAEDRTHDILVPRDGEGFVPDATLASLRKWASLPEGGMLQTGLEVCGEHTDSVFGDCNRAAMEKKDRYLQSWEAELKTEFLAEIARAETLLDADAAPTAMSQAYRAVLTGLDFEAVYQKRLKNVRRLAERLEPLHAKGRLRFLTEQPENSTLYFPIFLEERGAVQKAMAAHGVYCPVIWPEPAAAAGVCGAACFAVDHMLAIPCDQRYDEKDMDFIADSLIEILRSKEI